MEERVAKTYKFKSEVAALIVKLSDDDDMSETAYLTRLIKRDAQARGLEVNGNGDKPKDKHIM